MGKRKATGVSILLAALAVTAAYGGVSAYVAQSLSRATHTALSGTPADYGAAYETVHFPSAVDGVPLEGWYIDSPGSRVVLLMHANGGARDCIWVGLGDVARELWRSGYDVLAFDFRAHGASGGDRATLGAYEARDVAGAVAYLKTRGVSRVGAVGFSLGADAALLAAPGLPELRAIVADSPYADAGDLLATELPKQSGLPALFNPGVFLMGRLMYGVDVSTIRPVDAVARLGDRPLLLIHGEADSTIPLSHAYALERAAAGNPNMRSWIAPGAEHARAFKVYPAEFMERVLAFFAKHLD